MTVCFQGVYYITVTVSLFSRSTFMFPRKENSASFGRADNSPVILTNLYCSGLELDLASCHYDNVTTTYCGPSNARAAVKCIEDKAGDLDPEPPSKVHQLLGVFIILGVAGMACVVACVLCVVCWHKQCCCWDSSSRTMPEAHSTTTVCSSTGETRELRRSVNLHHCGQVNLAFSMDESAHRQDHTEREHRACSSSSDSFAQTMNFNNFHSIWSLNSAVISETVSGSPRQVPFRLQRPPSYSEIVRGDLPPTYEDAIKCV